MSELEPERPWHASLPPPRNNSPGGIDHKSLLKWMETGGTSGVDFLLVDLRRADHIGGTIRGSINLPAQSVYGSLQTLYKLCKASKIEMVIWYCGSSRGRGTRAAGWFADLIDEMSDARMQSLILSGGIKGWVAAGEDYQAHMDGFDSRAWDS